jgi:hypothetical protein
VHHRSMSYLFCGYMWSCLLCSPCCISHSNVFFLLFIL